MTIHKKSYFKIIIFLLILGIIPITLAQPLLIAHQGGEYWTDKNFSYITKSIEEGADIIEIDIRLKEGQYIVKHFPFSQVQGKLIDALDKMQDKQIYLDIKDESVNPNDLINFVRERRNNSIIIGSFNKDILKKVNPESNVTIDFQCLPTRCSIETAKELNADWINPLPYFITKRQINDIEKNGFKFVPAGSENYIKQMQYAKSGAYAISVYEVGKFKKILDKYKNKENLNVL